MSRAGRAGRRGCLTPVVFAAALICVGAFLLFLFGGEVPVPGRCPTGFGWGNPGGTGEAKELLENQNFEASPAAVRDLEAGIVDERLVSALQTATEEHRVCVTAFKEGHYFLPGVPDTTVIPDGYGEAGGLPNTHYYGRAADIRQVDGKSVRGNGADPDVVAIGEILAGIPPEQRPDQIIGPPDWTETLGRSQDEGWILDEDQLELHEDHIHIGYRNEGSTSNTK
ncbi:MAG: hypothetical protein M3122_00410 [Actinomycetota bacterium]|nr:hypothetical protein [Actinomycetota bacterium]